MYSHRDTLMAMLPPYTNNWYCQIFSRLTKQHEKNCFGNIIFDTKQILGSRLLISPRLLAVDSGLVPLQLCVSNSKSLLETYVDKMYILFFVSQGIGLCNSTTAYVREINKKCVLSISNKCESCDVSMRYQYLHSHQSTYL